MPDVKLDSYPHAMEIDPRTKKPMPRMAVEVKGSYIRLAAEAKPTDAEDGDDLLIVDTGEVHIFYKGKWYKQ